MLQRDFFSKSSKCGLDHLCMMPSIYDTKIELDMWARTFVVKGHCKINFIFISQKQEMQGRIWFK